MDMAVLPSIQALAISAESGVAQVVAPRREAIAFLRMAADTEIYPTGKL
jgi:hypothetical protein